MDPVTLMTGCLPAGLFALEFISALPQLPQVKPLSLPSGKDKSVGGGPWLLSSLAPLAVLVPLLWGTAIAVARDPAP